MTSPDDMVAAVTKSMKRRTGRTLEEWVTVVQSSGHRPVGPERRAPLAEAGARRAAELAVGDRRRHRPRRGLGAAVAREYIDQQYSGPKAGLRPILDRLRELIVWLSDDVQVEGRSTYTPFVRRRQFAAIAAATRTRVDVGLRYTDPPGSELLTPANAPGQATHKLSLMSVEDITGEPVGGYGTARSSSRRSSPTQEWDRPHAPGDGRRVPRSAGRDDAGSGRSPAGLLICRREDPAQKYCAIHSLRHGSSACFIATARQRPCGSRTRFDDAVRVER
jgi:hypothetical protein